MNSKISLPELVEILAQKLDCTKKEAEAFLKEFFQLAGDTVSQGESLKINGLGSFKLTWVEKRASVNVQTGEPFEIPGHYKLSFSPDKEMKEAVNAPFSFFNVEILDDNTTIPNTPEVCETEIDNEEEPESQTDDDVIIIAETEIEKETPNIEPTIEGAGVSPHIEERDLEVLPLETELEIVEEKEEEDSSEAYSAEKQPEISQLEAEPKKVEKIIEEESEHIPSIEDQQVDLPLENKNEAIDPIIEMEIEESLLPIAEIKPAITPTSKIIVEIENPVEIHCQNTASDELISQLRTLKKRTNGWRITAITLLILIFGFITYLYLDSMGVTPYQYSMKLFYTNPKTVVADSNKIEVKNVDTIQTITTDTVTKVSKPEVAVVEKEKIKEPKEKEFEVKETPKATTEVTQSGVYLTTLAKKHYGNKVFWVYIYEENRDVIKNPNNVPQGITIRIPEKLKYKIDAENSESVAKAVAKATSILMDTVE